MHLLSGPVDIDSYASASPRSVPVRSDEMEDRLAHLESEVAALKDELAALRSRFGAGDPV